MTTGPVHVRSIDHVTIVVRDLAATRQFYVDWLGLAEVARPPFTFAGQWFQAGATQIHTILESGEAGAAWANGPTTRGHHFAFLVDDAPESARQLQELGVPLVGPPKLRPDGAVQVFLRDPDGHLVELTSPAGTSVGTDPS